MKEVRLESFIWRKLYTSKIKINKPDDKLVRFMERKCVELEKTLTVPTYYMYSIGKLLLDTEENPYRLKYQFVFDHTKRVIIFKNFYDNSGDYTYSFNNRVYPNNALLEYYGRDVSTHHILELNIDGDLIQSLFISNYNVLKHNGSYLTVGDKNYPLVYTLEKGIEYSLLINKYDTVNIKANHFICTYTDGVIENGFTGTAFEMDNIIVHKYKKDFLTDVSNRDIYNLFFIEREKIFEMFGENCNATVQQLADKLF